MSRILVCQHVPHEILGTLNPLIKQAGFRIKYINFGRHPLEQPNLDSYDGLIVLGGPMNVDEVEKHPHLVTEMHLIEQAIQKDIPILGVCLGAQLMAKVLGASVSRNPEREIGWYDVSLTENGCVDPLFKSFQKVEKIFQWHGDTFDIPSSAIHLASTPTCTGQAFRYGDRVYGFQFHLEVDEAMIDRWLKVPANQQELDLCGGKIHIDEIRRLTPRYIQRLKELSGYTFGAFLNLFGETKKVRRLPSR